MPLFFFFFKGRSPQPPQKSQIQIQNVNAMMYYVVLGVQIVLLQSIFISKPEENLCIKIYEVPITHYR